VDALGKGAPGFEQLHAAHEALDMFDFAAAQERLARRQRYWQLEPLAPKKAPIWSSRKECW